MHVTHPADRLNRGTEHNLLVSICFLQAAPHGRLPPLENAPSRSGVAAAAPAPPSAPEPPNATAMGMEQAKEALPQGSELLSMSNVNRSVRSKKRLLVMLGTVILLGCVGVVVTLYLDYQPFKEFWGDEDPPSITSGTTTRAPCTP